MTDLSTLESCEELCFWGMEVCLLRVDKVWPDIYLFLRHEFTMAWLVFVYNKTEINDLPITDVLSIYVVCVCVCVCVCVYI